MRVKIGANGDQMGASDVIEFIIGTVVVMAGIVIIALMVDSQRKKGMADALAGIPDFTATLHFLADGGINGIAFDSASNRLCLLYREAGALHHRIVDYRDVIAAAVVENGHTVSNASRTSQVGGALVGGVLLGGVGAMIGGLSGTRVERGKVSTVELHITINDTDRPVHTVTFQAIEAEGGGIIHQQSSKEAREWQARLDTLMKRADRELTASTHPKASENSSVADELNKLVQLRNDGILTMGEFDSQKAKLLG